MDEVLIHRANVLSRPCVFVSQPWLSLTATSECIGRW